MVSITRSFIVSCLARDGSKSICRSSTFSIQIWMNGAMQNQAKPVSANATFVQKCFIQVVFVQIAFHPDPKRVSSETRPSEITFHPKSVQSRCTFIQFFNDAVTLWTPAAVGFEPQLSTKNPQPRNPQPSNPPLQPSLPSPTPPHLPKVMNLIENPRKLVKLTRIAFPSPLGATISRSDEPVAAVLAAHTRPNATVRSCGDRPRTIADILLVTTLPEFAQLPIAVPPPIVVSSLRARCPLP